MTSPIQPGPAPSPGLAPAPVGSSDYAQNLQDSIDAYARQEQASLQYRAQNPGDNGILPDWLMKPIEYVGSKMYAVWRPVARAITTPILASQIAKASAGNGQGGQWGNLLSGDVWDRAWADAKHVSPGQGIYSLAANFFTTPSELFHNLNKGQPGNSLIWDNPNNVRDFFDHGSQKYLSGGLDAVVSWYADPFVLAGKTAGIASRAAYYRPLVRTRQTTIAGKALETATKPLGKISPKLQFDASKITIKSPSDSVLDSFKANILKQDPNNVEAWVANQPWARNSADAGAIANAIGKAVRRGPDELDDVLKVTMGSQAAKDSLRLRNAELEKQLDAIDQAQKAIPATLPANVGPTALAIYGRAIDYYAKQAQVINNEQRFLESAINARGAIKELRYNPILTPAAQAAGRTARAAASAGAKILRDRRFAGSVVFNNLFLKPVRMIGGALLMAPAKDAWQAIRPNGWVDLHDTQAFREVQAQLQESKAFTPEEIAGHVSDFLKADSAEARGVHLVGLETTIAERIARKYGLTEEQGRTIYAQLGGQRAAAQSGRVYSTAKITLADGTEVPIDVIDDAGNIIAPHPVLNTQLENTHTMLDFQHFDKVLRYNGSAIGRLIDAGKTANEAASAIRSGEASVRNTAGYKALRANQALSVFAGVMGQLWKFNVLLRLGYGPRAISDDLLGQVARQGAYQTILERGITQGGLRNVIKNINNAFNDPSLYHARRMSLEGGVQTSTERIADLTRKRDQIAQYLPPNVNPPKGSAARKLHAKRQSDINDLEAEIARQHQMISDTRGSLANLDKWHAKAGTGWISLPDGTAIPAAFEGAQGALFKDLNSGRRTIDSMMGGSASDLLNYFRSGSWDVLDPARLTNEAEKSRYLGAWLRDVQHQIAQDPAMKAYYDGWDLEKWFRTPEGQAYRKASPYKSTAPDIHADRLQAHAEHYLPTIAADGSRLKLGEQLRLGVVKSANDATMAKYMKDFLKAHPTEAPAIQAEGLAHVLGTSGFTQTAGRIIDKWYHVMNQLPSEILSRNPLFNTLYKSHAAEIQAQHAAEGITHLSNSQIQDLAELARKRALVDVKKLTFNMDFESKLAYQMRFIAPFFGPMQESFTRWGRIMAEKPEVFGHFVQAHTAPIRGGYAVDQNGNEVSSDGYVTNPDGSRKLVAKGDMHVRFQMPDYLAKKLGAKQVDMPINTLNLVLQNDPWYNPGTGPWVQLPANEIANHVDPRVGDFMEKVGILPQGISIGDQLNPLKGSMARAIETIMAPENSDAIQNQMLQIMQAEDYKWKNHMRSTEPKWTEIQQKAKHNIWLKAFMSLTLPVSANLQDPYQMFRDKYRELQQSDPTNADAIFYDRYGEAAFAFTASRSKNITGLPASAEGVMAGERWANLIHENPDYAMLIAGPESAGTYSDTAYRQQLNAGDRAKISAKDAMDRMEANAGWVVFQRQMKGLKAVLLDRGLSSFNDPGAEDLKKIKQATVSVLGDPYLADGVTPNPHYNEQWSTQYKTFDPIKDDRNALALENIAKAKELNAKDSNGDLIRKDILGLQLYLAARHTIKGELATRKAQGGSDDIEANSNLDLKQIFQDNIDAITEKYTAFQTLHDRWLSRDMFDHYGG